MCDVEYLFGAGDRDVGEATLFFKFLWIVDRPRMRKYAVLKSNEKNDGKVEPFGGVHGHQRYRRISIVFVRVRSKRRVVDKISQAVFLLLIVVNGCVYQLLEVFEPSSGLVGILRPQRICVALSLIHISEPTRQAEISYAV